MWHRIGWLLAALLIPSSTLAQGTGARCALPDGYDPSRRPGAQEKATPVELGVFVVDIDRVDDVEQSFRADIFVTAAWGDDRLAGLAGRSSVQECRFGLEAVWNPQIVLFNRREYGLQLPDVVRVDDAGTVSVLRRFQGTLRAPLDLQDFPLDRQELPLTFISTVYGPSQVALHSNEEVSGHTLQLSLPGWVVTDRRRSVGVFETPARAPEGYVRLDDRLVVERELGYYVWRAIAPLTFIVLMSWAVFFIDPDNVGVQIGLASTSMLTLIAFLFSLNAILPPISYLTRMDFFLFGSLSLVFIAFGEAVITAFLARRKRHGLALRMDRWARALFLGLLLLVNAVAWRLP